MRANGGGGPRSARAAFCFSGSADLDNDRLILDARALAPERAGTRMTHSLMSTYNRLPVTFTHGEGARLWDTEGKSIL